MDDKEYNDEKQKLSFLGRMLNGDDADSEVETLQPVPLGENLNECLVKIINEISNLNGQVYDLAATQRRFNARLMSHTHITTAPGVPTTPLIAAIENLISLPNELIPTDVIPTTSPTE